MMNVSMSPDLSAEFQAILDDIAEKAAATSSASAARAVVTQNAVSAVNALVNSKGDETQASVADVSAGALTVQHLIDTVNANSNANFLAANKQQMVSFIGSSSKIMNVQGSVSKSASTFITTASWLPVLHGSLAGEYHTYAEVSGKSGGWCGVLSATNNNISFGQDVCIRVTIDGDVKEYVITTNQSGYPSFFYGFTHESASTYSDKISIGSLPVLRSLGLYEPFSNSLKVEVKLPTKPRATDKEDYGVVGYFVDDDVVIL
jgi:hypothetical protein